MEHYERDEIYARHVKMYKDAMIACRRKVGHVDALEVFVAALENAPVESDVGALLVFFRSQLAQNIPLNWFAGKEIRRDIFIPRQELSLKLPDSFLKLFEKPA